MLILSTCKTSRLTPCSVFKQFTYKEVKGVKDDLPFQCPTQIGEAGSTARASFCEPATTGRDSGRQHEWYPGAVRYEVLLVAYQCMPTTLAKWFLTDEKHFLSVI